MNQRRKSTFGGVAVAMDMTADSAAQAPLHIKRRCVAGVASILEMRLQILPLGLQLLPPSSSRPRRRRSGSTSATPLAYPQADRGPAHVDPAPPRPAAHRRRIKMAALCEPGWWGAVSGGAEQDAGEREREGASTGRERRRAREREATGGRRRARERERGERGRRAREREIGGEWGASGRCRRARKRGTCRSEG